MPISATAATAIPIGDEMARKATFNSPTATAKALNPAMTGRITSPITPSTAMAPLMAAATRMIFFVRSGLRAIQSVMLAMMG